LHTSELFDLVEKVAHHVGVQISAEGSINRADLLDETLHHSASVRKGGKPARG
jgi:hypothetical protein